MQIFALFQYMSSLNLAITYLKQLGFESRDIFIVPMEKKDNDFSHHNKKYPVRRDAVDKGFAFATGCSVIMAGIGFRLSWGPIIWGIIGAIGGYIIGFITSLMRSKGKSKKRPKKEIPMIMIVNSKENRVKDVEKKLNEAGALGINTPLWKDSNI